MQRYNVTPYVLGGVENGMAILDEGDTKQVHADTSIQAAMQHRPPKVQFWIVRKA